MRLLIKNVFYKFILIWIDKEDINKAVNSKKAKR